MSCESLMISWIGHSGAPGWITARTLQCLSDIGHRSSSHCLEVEEVEEEDWYLLLLLQLTDWQQTVCLFSYYPI